PPTDLTRFVGIDLPVDHQTDTGPVVDAAYQIPSTRPRRHHHIQVSPPCNIGGYSDRLRAGRSVSEPVADPEPVAGGPRPEVPVHTGERELLFAGKLGGLFGSEGAHGLLGPGGVHTGDRSRQLDVHVRPARWDTDVDDVVAGDPGGPRYPRFGEAVAVFRRAGRDAHGKADVPGIGIDLLVEVCPGHREVGVRRIQGVGRLASECLTGSI